MKEAHASKTMRDLRFGKTGGRKLPLPTLYHSQEKECWDNFKSSVVVVSNSPQLLDLAILCEGVMTS